MAQSIGSIKNIPPGATHSIVWLNALLDKVYMFSVLPTSSAPPSETRSFDLKAEVSKVEYHFVQHPKETSQLSIVIHITNTGSSQIDEAKILMAFF
ncbi:MAG TPA: hypothetical protein V6C85_21510 [Allocoleopsis sp.]